MINVLMATAKRNYRTTRRAYPWSFFIGRVLIGVYTALFAYFTYHYMFRGNLSSKFQVYTGSSDYMTFVILGSSLYILAVSTLMNVGRSLISELREGTLDTLLLSPASRKGYFFGNLLEQTGRASLEFLVTLLVGWLLGAKFLHLEIGQIIIVLILAISSFFAMSVSLASFMLYTRDTYISQNTIFIIMSFICGISFPIQYLPNWLQYFSHLFPLTAAVKLFRSVVIAGQGIGENLSLVIELIILTLIYLKFGFWWLSKTEKQLIEKIWI